VAVQIEQIYILYNHFKSQVCVYVCRTVIYIKYDIDQIHGHAHTRT